MFIHPVVKFKSKILEDKILFLSLCTITRKFKIKNYFDNS